MSLTHRGINVITGRITVLYSILALLSVASSADTDEIERRRYSVASFSLYLLYTRSPS